MKNIINEFIECDVITAIHEICKKYNISNYTINEDGSIDVDGNVDLKGKGLTKLPLKFGKVTGDFTCYNNRLTTLEGAPSTVGGHFYCHNNKLTTLEGCPTTVGGGFSCGSNIKELWNASSDVFKVLYARCDWVIKHNLWNM